jgi:uncharacterized paraquat-inducible protein A
MDFEELEPILCGRCGIAVQVTASSRGEERVSCPRCGETDTLDDARREASRHTAHRVLSAMLSGMGTDRPELAFRFVEGGRREPWSRAARSLRRR